MNFPFHKEVPGLEALPLHFHARNEEKVFNPEILTSKRVHTSLLPELSHRSPKAFTVIKILESPMEIFPCSYPKTSVLSPDTSLMRCQKPITYARLDVAKRKLLTWLILAFKLIIPRVGTKRISEERTKNQAKTDKTKHGMEKREKVKVKSTPENSRESGGLLIIGVSTVIVTGQWRASVRVRLHFEAFLVIEVVLDLRTDVEWCESFISERTAIKQSAAALAQIIRTSVGVGEVGSDEAEKGLYVGQVSAYQDGARAVSEAVEGWRLVV
ncbi:hypothetical protein Tco_0970484 [Tanacetum coccineum]